jgi:hypothetical protein
MRAIKVNNPQWLPTIAPRIAEYVKAANVDGILYENLYAYFAQSIQFGGSGSEFWAVFDSEDNPVAFAHWVAKGLPHSGKAYFDHIYKWSKAKRPVHMLIDEFINFSKRMRCTVMDADLVNEKVFSVFEKHCADHGLEITRPEIIYITMRKKHEDIQEDSD